MEIIRPTCDIISLKFTSFIKNILASSGYKCKYCAFICVFGNLFSGYLVYIFFERVSPVTHLVRESGQEIIISLLKIVLWIFEKTFLFVPSFYSYWIYMLLSCVALYVSCTYVSLKINLKQIYVLT